MSRSQSSKQYSEGHRRSTTKSTDNASRRANTNAQHRKRGPQHLKGRSAGTRPARKGRGRGDRNLAIAQGVVEAADESEETTPTKSTSAPKRKRRVIYDEEDEEPEINAAPAQKKRKGTPSLKRKRDEEEGASESEESGEDEDRTPKRVKESPEKDTAGTSSASAKPVRANEHSGPEGNDEVSTQATAKGQSPSNTESKVDLQGTVLMEAPPSPKSTYPPACTPLPPSNNLLDHSSNAPIAGPSDSPSGASHHSPDNSSTPAGPPPSSLSSPPESTLPTSTVVGIERKTGVPAEQCCYSSAALQALSTLIDVEQLGAAVPSFPVHDLDISEADTAGMTENALRNWLGLIKEIRASNEYFDVAAEFLHFMRTLDSAASSISSLRLREVIRKNRDLFAETPSFDGRTQEDACEFLQYLLLTLHNAASELLQPVEAAPGAEATESCIDAAFTSTVHWNMRCEGCGHTREGYESNLFRSVPVPKNSQEPFTLDSAVDAILEEERIDDYKCAECFVKCRPECTDSNCKACAANKHSQVKEHTFSRLPDNLVISFNRTDFTSDLKIATEVELPFDGYELEGEGTTVKYEMTAVVKHTGNYSDCGHYVCYKKVAGKWWRCDDENVKDLSFRLDVQEYIQGKDGTTAMVFLKKRG
ncbi:cysteine proteinase [Rhizodiscina lignyota]|uniref:Cysteine proteinase n=1 Tax=Rhizodiscina lignyota TaxID=1504668 RepID=A0A9P4MFG5_9PEZI|nr:cysteine proteinase [Rhizodiscina lignyota]